MSIYEITENELETHETLDESDLGKWFYVDNVGCLNVFDDEESAEDSYAYVMEGKTQRFKKLGERTIPVWAVCYLAYGDPGDLSDHEMELADGFVAEINQLSLSGHTTIDFPECIDSAKEFKPCDWTGLGSDVIEVGLYGMAKLGGDN